MVTSDVKKNNVSLAENDIDGKLSCEQILKEKEDKIKLSEKRYEIAMQHSEIMIFDYIVAKKQIIQSEKAIAKYGLSTVVENAVETFISSGLVHDKSVESFREVYKKIDNGVKEVSAIITFVDLKGNPILNEVHISNIYDSENRPIRAIGVMVDKTELNQLEREEQYRKAMTSDKILTYEVNITKDVIEYINPTWAQALNVFYFERFEDIVCCLCNSVIHADSVSDFKEFSDINNIIAALENGKTQIELQYRRRTSGYSYNWVQNTMNIIRDEVTNDIKIRCYIHTIDDVKKKELDLLFQSEHDALTEMLNRRAAEQRINSFLSSELGKDKKHAFFLFDIDLFKQINDNFGHCFGDAVLSQVSEKVKELFRDDDILARIGGDEFIVLMKNITSYKIAMKKAEEICNAVYETYTQNGKKYHVSISVGVALYSSHGENYQQLYEHSDAAMYAAKKAGGNKCLMYMSNMSCGLLETKEIDTSGLIESKSFEKNIAEYVFRILYESVDKNAAINSVLELVGKQYQTSRAYIFENSDDDLYTINSFEWCSKGISPQKQNLQKVPYSELGDYKNNFNDYGIYYVPDVSKSHPDVKKILKPQEITGMLQFAILKNEKFSGFIGFDQCGFLRVVSKEEVSELKNISNILGVFLMEMRALAENEKAKNIALSIVNGLDSYAYVIEKDEYKLLFINDKTKTVAPDAKIGDYCYAAFWNYDKPCEPCPMAEMLKNNKDKFTMKIYNHILKLYTKTTSCVINWTDNKDACLLDCVDITEYVDK